MTIYKDFVKSENHQQSVTTSAHHCRHLVKEKEEPMTWMFARDRRPWPQAHFASWVKVVPSGGGSRLLRKPRQLYPVFNC